MNSSINSIGSGVVDVDYNEAKFYTGVAMI